ncbi:sucrose-6-phosphate hydrolase-like [Ostrinia nubilalis]|uniref:sucrose-6-phosphate hydrolase-like n=1 Tax=Ostrinia nubilalis TaxID=29057 RepID=UPI0030822B32
MGYLPQFSIICCLLIGIKAAVNDRYYPRYHLAPPQGWMNDPNGFSVFNGEYHLFYQYNPLSSLEPGIAHWGHAVSEDLFHWEHLPIAMYPNNTYDSSGVFSGSALIEDDIMYLFYTGNVNHPNEQPNREQRQALAESTDGIHVTKYENNPIIMADDRQPNIRDPKVWKHGSKYYMVLGNSFENDTLGRALLYSSDDKINWEEISVLHESDGSLGFMYECPDFFKLNGKYVLLFSSQGIEPQGDKYRNLFQTGYIVGNFNYETNEFHPITSFQELDHGHDFYATQTIKDNRGRRLLVAWFDMWERNYPQAQDGFTGQMTIVRELHLTRDNKLIQEPVSEVKAVRANRVRRGKGRVGDVVTFEDKAGEIDILGDSSEDLEVVIEGEGSTVTISYDASNGTVTLDRGGDDGVRRTEWKPSGSILKWTIYVDASSIELFCGKGEVTFSSRFFPDGEVSARISSGCAEKFSVYNLKRTVKSPEDETEQ